MTPRLDRWGDPIEDAEPDTPPARHQCDRGWLDVDTDTIRPCPTCKPDLTQRLRRQRERTTP